MVQLSHRHLVRGHRAQRADHLAVLPADARLVDGHHRRGQVFATAAHVSMWLARKVTHVCHLVRPLLALRLAGLADVRTRVVATVTLTVSVVGRVNIVSNLDNTTKVNTN